MITMMKIASKRTENTNRRAAVGAEREANKDFGFRSTRRLALLVVALIKSLGEIILTRLALVFLPPPLLNVTALTAAINSSLI